MNQQVLQQYKTSPNSLLEYPPGSSVKSRRKQNVCRPTIIAIGYCKRTIDIGHYSYIPTTECCYDPLVTTLIN